MQSSIAQTLPPAETSLSSSRTKPELWVMLIVLVVLNLPVLLGGEWNHAFTFRPAEVAAGEWWRLLSFPFVHVSTYHLLIDGLAFAFLYSSLSETSALKRLVVVAAAAWNSLLLSVWADPQVQAVGLCGLSGVGHGLMAICAVEMCIAEGKTGRTFGYISFAVLFLKCIGELLTGKLLFDLVHFGTIGVPIVVCHAGGMVGALVALLLLKGFRPIPDDSVRPQSN